MEFSASPMHPLCTPTFYVKFFSLSLCFLEYAASSPLERLTASTTLLNTRNDLPLRENSLRENSLFYDFVTRPDIGAPRWNVQVYDQQKLSSGYWFVAPYANLDQGTFPKWNGPYLYDNGGELVWSGAPLFNHWNTFDFRVVQVGGEPMMSLLDPHEEDAEGVILDNHYEVRNTVDLTGELKQSNMHDFTVVDDGINALTLTNVPGPASRAQSEVIGFDGECRAKWEGFKELRVKDSKVLFEWSARDWIGLDECTFIPGPVEDRCGKGSWDILHLNSIDKFPDGDYLISSRHMNALYKVSHTDGHIVWRLGGKKSDFDLKDAAVFSRQHHARVRGQNETHIELSLFDNAHGTGPEQAEQPTNQLSRGLHFALRTDTQPRTAELLAHFDHPRGSVTDSRGSMQFLPNGNIFMGWTYSSLQSEHGVDGTVLMEANLLAGDAHSYRNYKFPWVGRPIQPPDVYSVAVEFNGVTRTVRTMVYVSWNGATEVNGWRLYKSNADGTSTKIMTSSLKQGFETGLTFDGYAAFVVVEAVDASGQSLEFGRSEVIKTIIPSNMFIPDVATEMQWLEEHSRIDADDDHGDRQSAGGLWRGPLNFMRNPFVVFVVGAICSAAVCFCAIRWRSRFPRRWWTQRRPLYGRVSRWSHSSIQMPGSHRGLAEEFEFESDGEEEEEEEAAAAAAMEAKPLAR